MLKKSISLLLIYAIFLLSSFSTQIAAQTKSDALKADTSKIVEVSPNPDVKKVFSKDLQKTKSIADVTEVDFKKLERGQMKSASKSKCTKQQKTLLWVGIGAAIAATVVIIIVSGGGNDNQDPRANCSATCTAIGCPIAPPCP